ncbi:MAG: hypothetical protein AAF402_08465 [Pseudomonadota bacterium]
MKINSVTAARSFITAIAMMLLLPGMTLASGSGNGTWSAGDYHKGKQVFLKKLYCDTCPLAGETLTREFVQQLMPDIAHDGQLGRNLSFRERQSVRHFLRTKFNLTI